MSLVARSHGWRRSFGDLAILLAILAVAAGFRLNGLNWDDSTHQHPDERFLTDVSSRVEVPASIAEYFDTARSRINPYARGFERYAYGQLPLSLTRAAAEATGMTGFDRVFLPGRVLSAMSDVGTIVFAWLIARRVFNRRVAHLSAALLAVTVLHIQLAHFLAVDTFAAFFSAASLYFAQRAWQRGSFVDGALAGAMAGLAMACKVSAAALLPVLLLACIWPRTGRPTRDQVLDGLTQFGLVLIGAFVAFRIAEPYAFQGPAIWNIRPNVAWFADKAYWAEVSSGAQDVPYMIQWAGTPAFSFPIMAIVQWGMGPALGLAAFAGLALASWRIVRWRSPDREALLLVLWALVNLVYFGAQFAKFMRYLLPIYFALAILAAYFLATLVDGARGWRPTRPRLARIRPLALAGSGLLAGLVVAVTAGWAVAFSAIYEQPHSRIQASRWIYDNIPQGATLGVEHWDDRLPLSLGPLTGNRYRYAELTLYDPETPAKREKLIQTLDQADYVILASRRLVDSIPRLPERFPLATTYYRLLQGGELGFERVAQFKVQPTLGPIVIDTSRAQEDFTVYDHPTVEIWQKRPDYSAAQTRSVLGSVPVETAIRLRPIDGGKGALLLTPAERAAAVAGGTWSAQFDRDGLANQLPLPVWLIGAELLALSAVPLLWRWLRYLPDRGFGISKIAALAFVAYVPWLIASLKLAPFGFGTLVLSWALLVALSFAAVRTQVGVFTGWLRAEWRLVAAVEGVFLLGFALFTWIRMLNPDLWHSAFGGEKPMDFAYLNAVIKSDYFPPYDPWFAGGIINYYYFGFVLVAALVKLTGIVPNVAYNLAVATFYGALCAGVFSLALNLALPWRGRVRRGAAYAGAVASTLLVALLGNLDAGGQLVDSLVRIGRQNGADGHPLLVALNGVAAVVSRGVELRLDFWRSTRFIGPEEPGPIHEFPFFTFLYGDLHAHMLALPLTVAAAAVALSLTRALRDQPRRVPWVQVALGALLVGMLRAVNTWDFPTYTALALAGMTLGSLPFLLRGERAAWQTWLISVVVLAGLSQLLFLPNLQRYQLFYTGVEPVKAKTALAQYLTIHGLLLFLVASFFLAAGFRAMASRLRTGRVPQLFAPPSTALVPATAGRASLLGGPGFWVVLAGLVGMAVLFQARAQTAGVALFGVAVGLAGALEWVSRPSRAFLAGMVALAMALTLVPEYVALQGDVGRMNTVFKFYLQAWVLLGVAAGVGTAWLVRWAQRDGRLRNVAFAWQAVGLLLLLAAAAYPAFAAPTKINLRFAPLAPTLDGMAYMDVARYQDRERDLNLPADARAIRWLQDNVQGSPVVLEGRTPLYRWGSRVSIYTGLPTVLGWDWHQTQQRVPYAAMIQERVADVQRAYDSPNPADALAVIRKYGVRYVYVGGLERAYYAPAGLLKFSTMPQLRQVYDQEGVQVFEVVT